MTTVLWSIVWIPWWWSKTTKTCSYNKILFSNFPWWKGSDLFLNDPQTQGDVLR